MKYISILLTIQVFVQFGTAAADKNHKLIGDIKKSKSQLRSFSAGAQKWLNGIVPYAFDAASNMSNDEKQQLQTAMATISKRTNNCIRFVPRTTQKAYITFNALSGGCSSFVGRLPDADQPQQISIERPGCFYQGAIVHETLHAIGFEHEHTRPDRDSYINIDWSNINEDDKGLFDLCDARTDTPYDIKSIMHYGWDAACIDCEKATMTSKKSTDRVGSEDLLTNLDVLKIMQYYNCQPLVSPTVRFKSQETGFVLESNASGNVFGNVVTGSKYQNWTIQYTDNNDAFFLKNVGTGRFLDSDFGGNIYTLPFNGGQFQKWRFFELKILNIATGRALDNDYNKAMYTLEPNTGNFQNWVLY